MLVAIGALAYFGVLSPDKFLPERCTGPAGLDCIDKASVDAADAAETVTFVVKNNLGFNIAFNETTGYTSGGSDDCATINANYPEVNGQAIDGGTGKQVNNAEQATIVIDCNADIANGRFKADFTVPYKNLNSGLYHVATFSITGVASGDT